MHLETLQRLLKLAEDIEGCFPDDCEKIKQIVLHELGGVGPAGYTIKNPYNFDNEIIRKILEGNKLCAIREYRTSHLVSDNSSPGQTKSAISLIDAKNRVEQFIADNCVKNENGCYYLK